MKGRARIVRNDVPGPNDAGKHAGGRRLPAILIGVVVVVCGRYYSLAVPNMATTSWQPFDRAVIPAATVMPADSHVLGVASPSVAVLRMAVDLYPRRFTFLIPATVRGRARTTWRALLADARAGGDGYALIWNVSIDSPSLPKPVWHRNGVAVYRVPS